MELVDLTLLLEGLQKRRKLREINMKMNRRYPGESDGGKMIRNKTRGGEKIKNVSMEEQAMSALDLDCKNHIL